MLFRRLKAGRIALAGLCLGTWVAEASAAKAPIAPQPARVVHRRWLTQFNELWDLRKFAQAEDEAEILRSGALIERMGRSLDRAEQIELMTTHHLVDRRTLTYRGIDIAFCEHPEQGRRIEANMRTRLEVGTERVEVAFLQIVMADQPDTAYVPVLVDLLAVPQDFSPDAVNSLADFRDQSTVFLSAHTAHVGEPENVCHLSYAPDQLVEHLDVGFSKHLHEGVDEPLTFVAAEKIIALARSGFPTADEVIRRGIDYYAESVHAEPDDPASRTPAALKAALGQLGLVLSHTDRDIHNLLQLELAIARETFGGGVVDKDTEH